MQEAKRLGCSHGGGSFCLCPKSVHTLSARTTQLSEAGGSCKGMGVTELSQLTAGLNSRSFLGQGEPRNQAIPAAFSRHCAPASHGSAFSRPSAAMSLFSLQDLDNCSFFFPCLECSSTINSHAVSFFTVGIQCQIPLDLSLAPVGNAPPPPVMPPWNLLLTYTVADLL